MLLVAEQTRINVYEETLRYDINGIDIKRSIEFRLN
jgi:hypothetical protein